MRDAVALCRASANSDRARAYRDARALPSSASAIGVLIQRMIQPVAAGVAFTIDPLTGASDEIVINSAYGLGTALVDGQVNPDEIRVRKDDGHIVSYRVADIFRPPPPSKPHHALYRRSTLAVARPSPIRQSKSCGPCSSRSNASTDRRRTSSGVRRSADLDRPDRVRSPSHQRRRPIRNGRAPTSRKCSPTSPRHRRWTSSNVC